MAVTGILAIPTNLILEKEHKEIIVEFSKAFEASIKMDIGNAPPKLQNAQDIFDNFGVSIVDQVECKISLTRKDAQSFLKLYGKSFKGNKLNREYLNISNYFNTFHRETPRLGKKDLVFTYAEVQYLVQYGTQLELTEELLKYLRP